jgi:PKD domain/Right handed beta helix region
MTNPKKPAFMNEVMRMVQIFARVITGFLLCWGAAGFAQAKDFPVSTADGVSQALSAAQGGDRIVLAPGLYGVLSIRGQKDVGLGFASPVIVTSQNAKDKAVIAKLELVDTSQLTFDGLLFDYTYSAGDIVTYQPFSVVRSSGITFANSVFDGDVAIGTGTPSDGFGTGKGLNISYSKSIRLENNIFFNWHRAAIFHYIEDLIIKSNEVTNVRSDGFDFAAITTALIEGNHMHDFRIAANTGDHWDMIQFWTNKTNIPSTNITIRNNFLDSGTGAGTQSIFMRNEEVDHGRMGDEMLYHNILIEGNLIRNAHLNAIVVGEAKSLKITRNTLLQSITLAEGGKVSVPSIRVALTAKDVEISNNIYPKTPRLFATPPAGWTISGNVVAQRDDSAAANYYSRNFVDALSYKTKQRSDLALLPDSEWAGKSIGSPLSDFDTTPEKPMAFFTHSRGTGGILQQDFTLPAAYGPAGALDVSSATISWSFGDGEAGTGQRVSHTYQTAGSYTVTATVKLPDMDAIVCERTIVVGYEIPPK